MAAFADAYFKQFRHTPVGMMRLDPQDAGPAYRNIIGLPGGTSSPLFQVLKVRSMLTFISIDAFLPAAQPSDFLRGTLGYTASLLYDCPVLYWICCTVLSFLMS